MRRTPIKTSMMKKIKQEKEKGKRKEMGEKKFSGFLLLIPAVILLFGAGCQPNRQIVNSSRAEPTPLATAEMRKTSVEQDVQQMRDVDFSYIFVLRRRDGGVFDKEDRDFLRQNMPLETNRRVFSSDEKAFIIGASFRFHPEIMAALRNRFEFEDFSKPEAKEANQPPSNQPANGRTRPAANK